MTPRLSRASQRRITARCRELGEVVHLSEIHELYWKKRWEDEVIAMNLRVENNHRRFNILRGTALVAGVVVPALVGLNLSDTGGVVIRWATFVLSIIAGVSIAIAELLRPGERWRINRTYFARIFREGIQFATLTGRYGAHELHDKAMPDFTNALEQLIEAYEDEYAQQVLKPNHPNDAHQSIRHTVTDGQAAGNGTTGPDSAR